MAEIIGTIVEVSKFEQIPDRSFKRTNAHFREFMPLTVQAPEDRYLTLLLTDRRLVYNAEYSSFLGVFFLTDEEGDVCIVNDVVKWARQ